MQQLVLEGFSTAGGLKTVEAPREHLASLRISSRPTMPQRRRISVFKRGRCLGSGCAGSGESSIQPFPRFVPMATSFGLVRMKRSNKVSALVTCVFNDVINSSAESGRLRSA